MLKCVVFDVDGTLIDTGDAIILSLQKVLREELGKEYTPEELYFAFGIPGAATLKTFEIGDIEGTLSKWLRYLDDFSSLIKVFEGIEGCLKQLRSNGIKTGIVTSKSREEFDSGFIPLGLAHYFDHVVCADDTAEHKPHPAPLLKLLELSGYAPEDIAFIGDTIYDKKCAEGAGVRFGLALWGAKSRDGIDPDWAFKDPEEILGIIAV